MGRSEPAGRPAGGGGFGLGWGVGGRPGAIRLSHSGGSNGGIAQLVVRLEAGIGYASFANSSVSYGVHGELQQRVLASVVPAEPRPSEAAPTAPSTPTKPVASDGFLGTFRRKSEITTASSARSNRSSSACGQRWYSSSRIRLGAGSSSILRDDWLAGPADA